MPRRTAGQLPQNLQHALNAAPLQADDIPFQVNGSPLGSQESTYMSSLHSSIQNYRYEVWSAENGRRYHAYREGAYPFPNDYEEQDRMDLGHHIYRLLLGGELYLAPIRDDPTRVLDLGTGTGIWAIDFAERVTRIQTSKKIRS
ncbi:hypothetical protein NW762_013379 [Fusarium torreyae]|uniref:Methyltransferase n=1 Tax=Fusarium torreyae TaxID=1237075 RepID=A0A9W8RNN8_9HYPO|nr:hypothetical protein NW762_013379 [Fusarium torreyae]